MESLKSLPTETRADVLNVLNQICSSCGDICSRILQVVAAPLGHSQGERCLQDMKQSGKLNTWLKEMLDLTREYHNKVTNTLDDFRFLLGTAYCTSEIFEALSKISPSFESDSDVVNDWVSLLDFLVNLVPILKQNESQKEISDPHGTTITMKTTTLSTDKIIEHYSPAKDNQQNPEGHNFQVTLLPSLALVKGTPKETLPSSNELNQPQNPFTEDQLKNFRSFGGQDQGPAIQSSKEVPSLGLKSSGQVKVAKHSRDSSFSADNPFSPRGAQLQDGEKSRTSVVSKNDVVTPKNRSSMDDNDHFKKDDSMSLGSFEDRDKGRKDSFDYFDEEDTKVQKERASKTADEKPVPKYKQVRDPALKQDLPPSKLQAAIKEGRSIPALGDQGRVFKPPRFSLPSVDIAKKYLTDFTTAELAVEESRLVSRSWDSEIRRVGQRSLRFRYRERRAGGRQDRGRSIQPSGCADF